MSEAARRFVVVAGSSAKFWEVEVDGASLTLRWGALGRDPQTKTKTLADAKRATAERDKLVAKKIAEGYREEGLSLDASLERPRVGWDTRTRALVHPRRASKIVPEKVDVAKAWKLVVSAFDKKARAAAASGRRSKELKADERAWMGNAIAGFDEKTPPDVPDPLVEAVRGHLIAIHGHHVNTPPALRKAHDALVGIWCAKHGVAFATRAMIETFRTGRVDYASVYVTRCHPTNVGKIGHIVNGDVTPWHVLRAWLAASDPASYAEARALAEEARTDTTDVFMAALSFIFPDEEAWAREALARCTYDKWVYHFAQPLISCFADKPTIQTFFDNGSARLDLVYDVLDALGPNALPILRDSYERGRWSDKRAQRNFFAAITMIESEPAARFVMRHVHDEIVGPLAEAYFERCPDLRTFR